MPLSTKVRYGAGGALILIALVAIAYPIWWDHRSSVGAAHILAKTSRTLRTAIKRVESGKSCTPSPGPGVLQIPALSLTAPVEQGTSNAVLNVSVGHDTATSWPGPARTAVFLAHDVSFFSGLEALKIGDIVTYTVPCATYTFVITAHQVTSPGASLHVPASGALVLDTCYPPNALWFTPDRYVVTATYQRTSSQSPTVTSKLLSADQTSIPAINFPTPNGLPTSELSLANNTQEMGQMHFSPGTSPAFRQSSAPITLEIPALDGWFGMIHTLEANNQTWWHSFAPKVSYPSQFAGHGLSSTSPLEITETAVGMSPRSVKLVGQLNGTTFTVTETIARDTLTITSLSTS